MADFLPGVAQAMKLGGVFYGAVKSYQSLRTPSQLASHCHRSSWLAGVISKLQLFGLVKGSKMLIQHYQKTLTRHFLSKGFHEAAGKKG